jgi:hypothetical protein
MNIHVNQSAQFIKLLDLLVKLDVVRLARHKVSISMLWGAKQPVINPTWIPLATVGFWNEYVEIVRGRKH